MKKNLEYSRMQKDSFEVRHYRLQAMKLCVNIKMYKFKLFCKLLQVRNVNIR